MPTFRPKRAGHATFKTPDLDGQTDYYAKVLGLVPVDRSAGRVCLASRLGQLSIVLEKADAQSCDRLAFEMPRDTSVTEVQKHLAAHGIDSHACSDPLPGVKLQLTFKDLKGTNIDLFWDWSFLDVGEPGAGVAPFKLGHIAFYYPDPKALSDWYAKVLGFRVSDWIGDYFVFMRCGADHHTVNFLRGDSHAMQHIAFELKDHAHLGQACDVLGRERKDILWGPVRHGPGHNVAVYHRNPDDQIIELFCDLDRIYDEELEYFEPRPWHRHRPQKPMVWDPSLPRDIWGQASSPEFRRPAGQKA